MAPNKNAPTNNSAPRPRSGMSEETSRRLMTNNVVIIKTNDAIIVTKAVRTRRSFCKDTASMAC